MGSIAHYGRLAALFDYPGADYPAVVDGICQLLGDDYPLAVDELRAFARALPGDGEAFTEDELDEAQEIFTRTFDVQSITTLGVGYVMFGDDYKRGELLVNLNREHSEAGVDCGTELPDHLPTVLRLLARWSDPEIRAEFVEEILHPALGRMIEEFGSDRLQERNRLYRKHYKTLIASSDERGTMFRRPLAALVAVLKQDFSLSTREKPEIVSDFLRSVGRELDIELTEGRPSKSGSML
jgi:nitrate reductase assembly molybdenum cofactor insertion protein NarJ